MPKIVAGGSRGGVDFRMANLLETLKLPQAESTVTDRLRYLMELARKTQAQFSRLVDVDPSTMSKILSERMPVSDSFINRVVVNLGVAKDWLVSGRGVPFPKNADMTVLGDAEVELNNTPKGAPVYNIDVTAGTASLSRAFTTENVIGYLDMPGIDPRYPIVRVTGDSMEPRIPNGSYVSIREITDPSVIFWGATYLVQLEDYRMVKMVRRHPDASKIILHSENPAYDDIEVDRRKVLRLFLIENVVNCTTIA